MVGISRQGQRYESLCCGETSRRGEGKGGQRVGRSGKERCKEGGGWGWGGREGVEEGAGGKWVEGGDAAKGRVEGEGGQGRRREGEGGGEEAVEGFSETC